MKILNVIKYLIGILAIIFIFSDWKLALILFLIASIVHVIPMGPNPLLSVITGYLMIGGTIYLFINWKIGLVLIIGSLLVAKFRVWDNKANYDYYEKDKNSDTKGKENPALWITPKAKNGKYVNCDIEGVKDEGQGTQMLKTRIYNFHKKHPTLWKSVLITLIITVAGSVAGSMVSLAIEYGVFK